MSFHLLMPANQSDIESLFTSVFTASEGEDEGKLVGQLSAQLAANIDNKDIVCIGFKEDNQLIGAIFFTRLTFSQSIEVFMLAPVAVSTKHQGKGVGQALINYGLDELKKRSVSIAVTYGDPAFYSKVGFQALSENVIQAPHPLSMPIGWLGQSLTENPIPTLTERPICVDEFNDPNLW